MGVGHDCGKCHNAIELGPAEPQPLLECVYMHGLMKCIRRTIMIVSMSDVSES